MSMQRRGFLKGLAALIGGVALEQAIPLGRVWSFPKEIRCVNSVSVISATIEQYADFYPPDLANLATVYYERAALDKLNNNFTFFDNLKMEPPTLATYRFNA